MAYYNPEQCVIDDLAAGSKTNSAAAPARHPQGSGVRLRSSTRSYGSVTPKPDSILKTSSTFSPSGGQNSMLRSNDSENSVEVVDDEAEEISQAETQMKAARFRRHKGLYQRPT